MPSSFAPQLQPRPPIAMRVGRAQLLGIRTRPGWTRRGLQGLAAPSRKDVPP